MKIIIYELLGMVKDGKAPKKIKFDTEKYIWCEEQEEYRRYPYDNNLYYGIWSDYDLTKCLNDEVEILDDEEKGLPEKLLFEEGKISDEEFLAKYITHNRNKINEIIDYLKKQRKR